MTCARVGCQRSLTPAQVAGKHRYCGRPCANLARRRTLDRPAPTHCRVCSTPLTWPQASRGEHCSLRCAMRTIHGTAAPTRTHCQFCDAPLSRRQQWRRRDYCSKGCAKSAYWMRQPGKVAEALSAGWARMRVAFVARLRAFLATATKPAAGRRGWRNGWQCARGRALAAGNARPPRRKQAEHVARCRDIATTAPTAAEAYRRCYREAYATCWRRIPTRGRR